MKFTDFTFTLRGLNIPPELSETITSAVLASPQRFYTIDWNKTLLTHAHAPALPNPSDPPINPRPRNASERLVAAAQAATASFSPSTPDSNLHAALRFAGDTLNAMMGKGGFFASTLANPKDNVKQMALLDVLIRKQEKQRERIAKQVEKIEKQRRWEEGRKEEREVEKRENARLMREYREHRRREERWMEEAEERRRVAERKRKAMEARQEAEEVAAREKRKGIRGLGILGVRKR
jgi:hypothetical protein